MTRDRILSHARTAGCEEMARKLLDQSYGADYVMDRVFQEAAKGMRRTAPPIGAVSDDQLARSLMDPVAFDFMS